jgi:GGDEF domain-containing protein
MPGDSPQQRLIAVQWAGITALALLVVLPRLLLEDPINPLMVLLRLGMVGLIALMCSTLNRREPEIAIGLYTVIVTILAAFDVRLSPHIWQTSGLEVLMYGVIGMAAVYGLTVLWGAPGLVGTFVLAGLVVALSSNPEQQIALALLLLVTGCMAWAMHRLLHSLDEVQRELTRRANTDAMTRMGNRRALEDDFRRFRANAKRFGVPLLLISWDVDGLKRINDVEGHAAGDAHLLGFVSALRATVRQGDGLYRIGGDEFISLHPGLSIESGNVLYRRVLQQFGFVSAGWVRATNDSLDAALEEADTKLYTEKEKRRVARFRRSRDTMDPSPTT